MKKAAGSESTRIIAAACTLTLSLVLIRDCTNCLMIDNMKELIMAKSIKLITAPRSCILP